MSAEPTAKPTASWDELAAGHALTPLTKSIDRTQLVRYAGAAGDFNRIHHDEPFAKEAGYPSVIAHGMLSMGFLGELLTRWSSATAVESLTVRFKAVTYPGDTITCHGEVTAKHEEKRQRKLDVRIWCAKQDGTVTVEGNALLRFP